jgi:two-component system, chemotaxis family, response regulator Rcp1
MNPVGRESNKSGTVAQTGVNGSVVRVLMVEDNEMDAILTEEILSESERFSYHLVTVADGIEALNFLRGRGRFSNDFRPDVIILDLNLPRMHGFDFLKEIKADPNLKYIPVCILTTSRNREDKVRAEQFQTECYMTKPLDLERFERTFFGTLRMDETRAKGRD